MSCVTTMPDPSSGSTRSSETPDLLKVVRSVNEPFRIDVLVPVNIGEGTAGKHLYNWLVLHVSFDVACDGLGSFDGLDSSGTKSDRKIVIDETTTATLASAWSQKTAQVVSICPLIKSPAATLMMLMIIRKMLRQSKEPRASFLPRRICTRHNSSTGIEMTVWD